MTLRKLFGLAATVFACGMMLASEAGAYMAGPSTVMVIPARQRLVKLGFELVQIKDICLVSYSIPPGSTTPLVHVWDGRQWTPIDVDSYVSGAFLSSEVKTLVVVGDSATVPASLAVEPSWAGKVHKTASMDVATLVNELGKLLRFSSREWERIAALENLTLKDNNAERRRYGRWGAPGKEKETEMPPPAISPEMPPTLPSKAPVVELKAPPAEVESLKVESKTEEKPVPPAPPIVAPPAPPAPPVAPPAPKVEAKAEEKPAAPAVAPAAPKVEAKAEEKPAAPAAAAPDPKDK